MTTAQLDCLRHARAWAKLLVEAIDAEVESTHSGEGDVKLTEHRRDTQEQLSVAIDDIWRSEADALGFMRPKH